jgi:hypothetical protein
MEARHVETNRHVLDSQVICSANSVTLTHFYMVIVDWLYADTSRMYADTPRCIGACLGSNH